MILYYTVDKIKGNISSIYYNKGFKPLNKSVDSKLAENIANNYINDHINILLLNKIFKKDIEFIDTKSIKEYNITWTEQINGLDTPNNISVYINADNGAVISCYITSFDNYTISPIPKLTVVDIKNIITSNISNEYIIDNIEYKLQYIRGNKLGWYAFIDWHLNNNNNYKSRDIFLIDANSGEIIYHLYGK